MNTATAIQLPHRPRPARAAVQYRKLAPRQAEALTHRAQGLTNAETAQAMRCSVANVANLLAECFFKLGARGATDAVATAIKHGLIQLCMLITVLVSAGPGGDDLIRTRFTRRPTGQIIRIRNLEG